MAGNGNKEERRDYGPPPKGGDQKPDTGKSFKPKPAPKPEPKKKDG
jgi:hypothetical protein